MDALRQGIYDALVASSDVTGAVAAYRGGYAIVDGFFVPKDMEVPCIAYEVVADRNGDTKTGRVRSISVDISVITSVNSDPAVLAEYVRTVFHRQTITVNGWTNIVTEVTGPIQGEYDIHSKMAVLSVTFTLA